MKPLHQLQIGICLCIIAWHLSVIIACGQAAPATPAKLPAPKQSQLSAAPQSLQEKKGKPVKTTPLHVEDLVFQVPEPWKIVQPSSAMRKAQLEITGKAGKEKAEVLFFYFGEGQGGSVEENIQRWFHQFEGEPQKKKASVFQRASRKSHREHPHLAVSRATFVQAEGTFLSGMPGSATTPMAGYGLCGAILECPKGNIFIKMTGPVELIRTLEPDFHRMIESSYTLELEK